MAAVVFVTIAAGAGGATKAVGGNWPTSGYSYDQNRHVPFTQITPQNVTRLGRTHVIDFQKLDKDIPGGQQDMPIMIGRTLYVTTSYDQAFAIDAVTGKVKWHFKPAAIGAFKNFGLNVNRGFAYAAGRLYMLTLDNRILELSAKSGKLLKSVPIWNAVKDAKPEFGYYETMQPVAYKGVLVIGSSGGDNGVRGFAMGYKLGSLKAAWSQPLWIVPPEGQGWRRFGRFHGGGAIWNSPAIDPATNTAYVGTGNPSPDFFPSLRPGPDKWVDAIMAFNPLTGKMKWARQQTVPDEWDYDTTATPLVEMATIGGKKVKVVSDGTKGGEWFAYNAATGQPIYQKVKFVDRIKRPTVKPGKWVIDFPGTIGGQNYAPASFDPTTNLHYIPAVQSANLLKAAETAAQVDKGRVRGDVDTGLTNGFGTAVKGWHDYGLITAINMNTGKVAWKIKTPEPERGGITTTASGLGFVGGGDGVLRAFNTKNGKVLWTFQTGDQISAGPTIYTVGGKEYIAVATGGTSTTSNGGHRSRLQIFTLGGSKVQDKPPVVVAPSATTAPPPSGNKYLTFGATPKTLNLLLVAAQGAQGGGLNFNGFSRGQMSISIPEGWSVNVTFKNLSVESPHSALITNGTSSVVSKAKDFPLAFPKATTTNPVQGILSGTQYFSFVASKAGTYAIVCGVPGHSFGGMWDYLKVVGPNQPPSVTMGLQTIVLTGKMGH